MADKIPMSKAEYSELCRRNKDAQLSSTRAERAKEWSKQGSIPNRAFCEDSAKGLAHDWGEGGERYRWWQDVQKGRRSIQYRNGAMEVQSDGGKKFFFQGG